MKIFHLVTIALALSFAACATDARQASALSDIELTWQNALSAVPEVLGGGGITRISDAKRQAQLEIADRKFPVVVYMHGCTGFADEDRGLIRKIAAAGYVVVAPDSMARKYRPLQCSSWDKKGGVNLFVFDFRQAEINFALQEMVGNKWADWDNLFIVGVSEGGLAAAHFRGDIFRARVITQWTCHGSTWVRGIDGPDTTPILSVVRRNDPWYDAENSKQAGDCGAFFGDKRPGSKSLVLERGSSHSVIGDDGVVAEIIGFLGRNRK